MHSLKDSDPAARAALMADLRSNCSGQLPLVVIFWYDSASHSLFGIRKQEVTPAQIEAAACDGLPFIIYLETNEEVWQQESPGRLRPNPSRSRLLECELLRRSGWLLGPPHRGRTHRPPSGRVLPSVPRVRL